MAIRLLILSAVLLLVNHANALDTSKCPATFEAEITNITAYATSIYSKEPGWLEARDNLKTLAPQTLAFTLQTRTAGACTYSDSLGSTARLFGWKYWDHEDGRDHVSDRLLIEISNGTVFTVFPEVESFDASTIRLFSQDSGTRQKVRTKLVTANGRRLGFDVGLAHIATK